MTGPNTRPLMLDTGEVAAVETALSRLKGVVALLLDAAYQRDPSSEGVVFAARAIEEIHGQILDNLSVRDL